VISVFLFAGSNTILVLGIVVPGQFVELRLERQ